MRKDLEFSEDLKRIEADSDDNLRALCFKLANQPNFTQFILKLSYFSSCSVKTNLNWDISSVIVLSKESWLYMSIKVTILDYFRKDQVEKVSFV